MNETLIYVSSSGDDCWSGKLPAPSKDKSDGPFRTIARAQEAVRRRKKGKPGEKISVSIEGGVYFLERPVTFTAKDSGTSSAPVIYKANGKAKVVISGGREVKGLKTTKRNGKTFWTAEMPDAASFSQLWVNGQRRYSARYPGKGYLLYKRDLKNIVPKGENSAHIEPEILKKIEKEKNLKFVFMYAWVDAHLPVQGMDVKKGLVRFKKSSRRALTDGGSFARYYIENVFGNIKAGQWYLDRDEKTLFYLPRPGEKPEKAEIIYPLLPHLFIFKGDSEKGRFVENIEFHDITFSHTAWELSKDDAGDGCQAAIKVKGAICAEGARNCRFENCAITHTGNYGIELGKGCVANTISNCRFSDLGAGGIRIGEALNGEILEDLIKNKKRHTWGNRITDCHIYDGGNIFHQAVGVWIGQSYNNLMAGNHVHDFYYSGISIGWTWGYAASLAHHNIVEHNHVHHVGIRARTLHPVGQGPVLCDLGGIYTLGIQPGTVIRRNIFHDIAGVNFGWGIYFDEGTSEVIAENNLVYKTTDGGFHQHYGKGNIVRNNIFAFGGKYNISVTRPEKHRSFSFRKNIVYLHDDNLLHVYSGNQADFNLSFNDNIYWNPKNKKLLLAKLAFEEWKEKGMDRHSVIADPLFVNPGKHNFSFKRNAAVKKTGFVPFGKSLLDPLMAAYPQDFV